jgi:hypothetical protein
MMGKVSARQGKGKTRPDILRNTTTEKTLQNSVPSLLAKREKKGTLTSGAGPKNTCSCFLYQDSNVKKVNGTQNRIVDTQSYCRQVLASYLAPLYSN